MRVPKAELEDALRKWWARQIKSPLRRRAAPEKTGGTVFDIQPEVSSQEAVNVFLCLEPLLGFKLKSSSIIKRGGYQDCDEFVKHLLPQLAAKFAKHHAAPTKSSVKTAGGVTAHASP